uniref:RNA binding motif protein 26 n=1 Tax=Electrophorus electricus TaxID=8005 RepID=A0A4W4F558_ELEEL
LISTMIIEDLDALKTWLSKTLEPICDADPSALAKYVVALVKKDKSDAELRALCVDQLDVFLQKETQTFVDKLFDAVNTHSYLPQCEAQSCSLDRADGHPRLDEQKKDELLGRDEDREKKFSRRVNHSPQPSSRYGRDNRRGDDRKKDERSRKREYDRNPPRRDSYRDRYNRRRGRSRSRSWSKDRARERDRERDRDRDRDRDRERDRDRDLSRTRSPSENYVAPPLATGPASTHFPVPALSSTITVIAPTHHGNSTTESWSDFHPDHAPYGRAAPPPPRKRCRDYDEKGFCMRGDLCPFDHGSDPVVVEDVNLPGMLPYQAPPLPVVDGPPAPGLPPPPALLTPPPVNLRPPVPPGAMPPSPPPRLPALQPSRMDTPPCSVTSSVPAIVTSGLRPPLTQPPPHLVTMGFNPVCVCVMNPRPVYRHRGNVQRPNLIGLTMGEMDVPPRDKSLNNNNSVRIVVESESRKRGPGPPDSNIVPKKPWFEKHTFNKPNHHGYQKKSVFSSANTKLAIRQIPPDLNTISKLNEYFSKFGTIVNLQVAYNNDPEGALIQFASPEEARRAIHSPEAVLNNRFIRVYWHREERRCVTCVPVLQCVPVSPSLAVVSVKQSVKERLGPLPPSSPADPPAQVRVHAYVFSTSTGLTKTFYNPAALKAGQKGALFGLATSTEETLKKKQEALKLQQDVRKKKQEILEKHIETQKLLISKLEKNKCVKAEDKAQLMSTLTTLTTSINKLQEELRGYTHTPHMCVRTKAQAQKELLDTELDLYKKTQAGEDTAQLKLRYTQLQLEAAKRGLLNPGRGRGTHPRGRGSLRGRGRGVRGRPRGGPANVVVDHRPRALVVSGFTEAERVDLVPHFAQFGEIEDCQMEDSSLTAVITYRTRVEAEQAALHGSRLNQQELLLSWHRPCASLVTADPDDVEHEEDEVRSSSLLFFLGSTLFSCNFLFLVVFRLSWDTTTSCLPL